MKNIVVLGSTGSIGVSTLDVVRRLPGHFRVLGLGAHSNTGLLARQVRAFHPEFVVLSDEAHALKLKKTLGTRGRLKYFVGADAYPRVFSDKRIDRVVLAIGGSGALAPLWAAVERGISVALANKEALVMAGRLIMAQARRHKAEIIPIDSEQSAIWQCLFGQDKRALKNLYLTASGGPLRDYNAARLAAVTVRQVLDHPRWKMGKKITVDSATLMNKGLEVIEAMHLFGVKPAVIKVLVHPEAIIHSMVEFTDGVLLAQLSATDMRIPIQYALSYPARLPGRLAGVDFAGLGALHFEQPDFRRFPCLGLAYAVAAEGGTAPCVLNAADEVCVDFFLRKKTGFLDIPRVIEKVLGRHRARQNPSISDIFAADGWARQEALSVLSGRQKG
ncbi:MAG: 1-deoxy-D-xylulose-5-phosphate reductoisomerase [Candidatus Omnitrophica bacterium]|nr:1-deoxy-D-xylulose-5-phosphate reductoisomerase [Candidatus Omnitrophota bacterium]